MKQLENGQLYLDIDDILANIRELSFSQGFYGRLYRSLIETKNSNKKAWDIIVNDLESQHFRTTLDMVLYFES